MSGRVNERRYFCHNSVGPRACFVTKTTTLLQYRLSAVRCRTLWTVNSTTTAQLTQLSATTSAVTTTSDNGSLAYNRMVCFY